MVEFPQQIFDLKIDKTAKLIPVESLKELMELVLFGHVTL
jgi:hypothetical protein